MSMIRKTLGNFTLEAQIGAGGMGEVYLADDKKLDRFLKRDLVLFICTPNSPFTFPILNQRCLCKFDHC